MKKRMICKAEIAFAVSLAALVCGLRAVAAEDEVEFDGVVTIMRSSDRYFFAHAFDGKNWRIDTEGQKSRRLRRGDLVHVKGLLERKGNRHTTRIFSAQVDMTGHDKTKLPPLSSMSIGELYSHPKDVPLPRPDWYATYGAVEGRVRDFWRTETQTSLLLEDGDRHVSAKICVPITEQLPEYLESGARVRVVGALVYSTVWSETGGRHPAGFDNVNVLSEDWKSIEVLSRPPFWTTGKIILAALVLIAIFAAILLWQRIKLEQERIAADAARRERLRLACDLHDDFQQLLASSSFRLQAVKNLMPATDEMKAAREQLNLATKSIEHTQTGLRTVLWSMTEESEGPSGLQSLFEYAAGRMAHWQNAVSFEFHGEERPVTRQFAGSLLMILQEAVGNSIRHGGADHIRVKVIFSKNELVMSIRDDGSGFEMNKNSPENIGEIGLGLRSMAERARSMGGECTIRSEIGHGTIVKVRLPL